MLKKILENIGNKFFFKEEIIGNFKIKNANIGKRFLAFLIDLVICFSLIISAINFLIKDNENILNVEGKNGIIIKKYSIKDEKNKTIINKVVNIIFIVLFGYFFVSNIYLKSTVGQKLLSLKIVSIKNKNVTFYEILNKSLFISFIILVSNVFILLLVFIIPLLLTNFKITFLDMLTNTVIIELKKIK